MNYINYTEKKKQIINQFNNTLKSFDPNDKVDFFLTECEISVLLKAELIVEEPLKTWFDKMFYRGQKFRSVFANYSNITIYKKSKVYK